ncbi:MAG: general secretion pathway protein L, partial [Myxococcota bacterium]
LDIGSHSIKAVELGQTMRGPQPGQMRLHPCPESQDDLPETLQRLVSLHHLGVENVIAAIPGDRISLRTLKFPFRDAKKLAAAVPFAVDAEVPFELGDVVIDWAQTGGAAGKSEILAALTRREEVSTRLALWDEAGIKPRVLEAEGLVLGNLTSVFDLTGNRLLLDIGHKKTTMCLLIDGKAVNARTVPVGGLGLTRAVAEARGVSLDDAEQIKCSEGVAGPDGVTLPSAAKILDRIAREVVRFIESNQGHAGASDEASAVGEITMMGGTSKLGGIADLLYEQTGIGAYPLGDPIEGEHAEIVAGGDPVLFAAAIALALRGSSLAQTQLNFCQHEFAYRTNIFQFFTGDLRPTVILAGIAASLAFLSFGTSVLLESSRANLLEERARQLYSEVAPGGAADNPVPALSQALREAQDRADFLGIYGTDLSAVDLLAELSRRIPEDVKVSFEDINIDRRVIKIKVLGESYQSADRLKSMLARTAPFGNAEVDKVKTTRDGGKTFNLTLDLVTEGESS